MAIITDVTLGQIKNAIVQRNQALYNIVESFDISTWELVQFNVKNGLASKYPVGSELMSTYTNPVTGVKYDYPWVVVDNDRECEWEDGTTHPALWLMAKYTSDTYVDFDAIEGIVATEETAQEGVYYCSVSGSTYTVLTLSPGDTIPYGSYDTILKGAVSKGGAYRDGYNSYKDSAVRQWLNSDAAINEWWESTHLGDNAPTRLDKIPGYMAFLDPKFTSVINPVKVQTARNTSNSDGGTDITYDRFFLASLEEVYAVAQIANVEGPYFPYWKTATDLNSPSNNANSGRIIYKVHDTSTAGATKLRSCSKNTAYNVWGIVETGVVSNNVAKHTWAVCPVCAIS